MGIGDWGLGIGNGDWAQSPIPNPQSPIPNPQSKQIFLFKNLNKKQIFKYKFLIDKYKCLIKIKLTISNNLKLSVFSSFLDFRVKVNIINSHFTFFIYNK